MRSDSSIQCPADHNLIVIKSHVVDDEAVVVPADMRHLHEAEELVGIVHG